MKKLPLTQGKFALVDDEDFERVNQFKWSASLYRRTWYALRSTWHDGRKGSVMLLHRFILNAPTNMQVDHINGDGLDCRRANMRLCVHSENAWNRGLSSKNKSGYKGVYWFSLRDKWRAQITANGRKIHLGLFVDKTLAARTYNEAALKYFGKFARLNVL